MVSLHKSTRFFALKTMFCAFSLRNNIIAFSITASQNILTSLKKPTLTALLSFIFHQANVDCSSFRCKLHT